MGENRKEKKCEIVKNLVAENVDDDDDCDGDDDDDLKTKTKCFRCW